MLSKSLHFTKQRWFNRNAITVLILVWMFHLQTVAVCCESAFGGKKSAVTMVIVMDVFQ